MMARTARGHTGRPLAADRFETAAVVRAFDGMLSPALCIPSAQLAALLWVAAFGLFALRYWPVLTRPRVDGKPG